MPRQNVSLVAFNRGIISPLGLARVDIERTAFSAETMTNWMPRVLGSMRLRMGSQYLGSTRNNATARFLPFVFAIGDTAIVEITDSNTRIWYDDLLLERSSVSTSVTNGAFTSDLASWTDNDEAGATSAWVTGGYMGLTGNGSARAIREQEVTVASGDQGTEHALRIVVDRGPVVLRVGSTSGDDDYISQTSIEEGNHSLAFTPTGNFFIEFSSALTRTVRVDSCAVESSGAVTIPSPWAEADLGKIAYDQSGDILFIACDGNGGGGYQQHKIERRATRSWSVVKYYADDGPFRIENTSGTTITPSATTGSITLTASSPLFYSTHVGALFYVTISSTRGIARVTAVASETSATADVISAMGGTTASSTWAEGAWSDLRGWPTAVAFAEGRLWWAGRDNIYGSISDDFYSFDDTVTGASGTISRTIGSGLVDTINWILALQRVLLGGEGSEFVCKSSSFDEPLTPTDFTVKPASTQGSAAVSAAKLDKIGIFVQRGGTRVIEIALEDGVEYGSRDLTLLAPEVTQPMVTRIAIQRQPDTRLHCVRSDGKVAVMVYDRAENVLCWSLFETDGEVEDVVVLPGISGDTEDSVYYVIKRTINTETKRYLEVFAFESEGVGETLNKQLDSFALYSGVSTTSLSGLSYLEAKTVGVWGNSKYLGTYTVASGAITDLSEAVTDAVVGLRYTAQWKSSKLAYAAGMGTALAQKKKINQLGLVLKDTYHLGLKYGPDFDNLDDLPQINEGAPVADGTVYTSNDEEMFTFPGEWNTDSRLCLQATSPNPCNILAAIFGIETHDKY